MGIFKGNKQISGMRDELTKISVIDDITPSLYTTYSSRKTEDRLIEIENAVISDQTKNAKMWQKTFLNVVNNDSLYMDSTEEFSLDNSIIQPYKFIEGEKNIVGTLKRFDNGMADNFIYDTDSINFENKMQVKDTYFLGFTQNQDNCESEDVITEDFLDIDTILLDQYSANEEYISFPKAIKASSSYSNIEAYDLTLMTERGKYTGPLTGWCAKAVLNASAYIQFEYSQLYQLKSFEIIASMVAGGYEPIKDFRIVASLTNTFDNAVTLYNGIYTKTGSYESFAIPSNKKYYKYYRIYLDSFYPNNGGNGMNIGGVYASGTSMPSTKFLIMKNDIYYSINEEFYNTSLNNYNPISEPDFNNGFMINDLYRSITIENETFRPIDKFITFKLISLENLCSSSLMINGIKNGKNLVVANDDKLTSLAHSINYFKMYQNSVGIGSMKVVFSIDKGVTWKTWKIVDNSFENLDIVIPNKRYTEMSDDEKSQYNKSTDIIFEKGIPSGLIQNLDFNSTLTSNTIRFAYVLYRPTYNDFVSTDKLDWSFNAKGHMKAMNYEEFEAEVFENQVRIKTFIDSPLIKVNLMA